MKRLMKILKIMLLIVILIIIMQISVFANTLTLKVQTDKEKYTVNSNVVVTVDWTEEMQAASFVIEYDSDKLEFQTSSIANTFYNNKKNGEISINWASMEEVDLNKITFTFKAIKTGEGNIFIKTVDAFADKNVVSPTSYDYTTLGKKTITINSQDNDKENTTINKIPIDGITDKTIASETMPKAGVKKTIFLIISILFIYGIVEFIKYKNIPKI